MPVNENDKPEKKAPKPQPKQYWIRLKRSGPNGEEGLASYYHHGSGRIYSRQRIYKVDRNLRTSLLATRKFEAIMEEDLEAAKKVAGKARGLPIDRRVRQKQRRAAAQRRGKILTAKAEAEADEFDEDEMFTDPEQSEREAEDDSVVSV